MKPPERDRAPLLIAQVSAPLTGGARLSYPGSALARLPVGGRTQRHSRRLATSIDTMTVDLVCDALVI